MEEQVLYIERIKPGTLPASFHSAVYFGSTFAMRIHLWCFILSLFCHSTLGFGPESMPYANVLARARASETTSTESSRWEATGFLLTRDGLLLVPIPPESQAEMELFLPGNRREVHRMRLGGGDGWAIIRSVAPILGVPRVASWSGLPEAARSSILAPIWEEGTWNARSVAFEALSFEGGEPALVDLSAFGKDPIPAGTPLFAGDGTVFAVIGPKGPTPTSRHLLSPARFLVWLRSISRDSPAIPWRDSPSVQVPFADPALSEADFLRVIKLPPGPERDRAAGDLTRQHPNAPLAWFAAAIVLSGSGKFQEAVAAARRVTALAPKQPAAWILLGRLWLATGEPARALDTFNQAIDLGAAPGSVATWVAEAHLRAGDRRAAIAWLQGIVRRDPSSRDAFVALAKLHEAGREWDSALRAWLVAARMNATDPEVWEHIARAYCALEQPAQAAEAYAEMALRVPGNGAVWYNLGVQLLAARRFEQAEGALRRAVDLLPEDPSALLHHGHALARLERLDEAAGAYQATLRVEPNSVSAWFNLGVLYSAANQPDEARKAYQEVLRIDSKNIKAWANLADLEHRLDRPSERDRAMESLQRLSPDIAAQLHEAWRKRHQPLP